MNVTAMDQSIKDFTIARPPILFKIDDDVFHARKDIPAITLIEFASTASSIRTEDSDAVIQFTRILRMVLEYDSAERFIQHMSSDTEPISLTHVQQVLPWLMEQYGLRPTEPSPDSLTGQLNPDDGTNSMASGSV